MTLHPAIGSNHFCGPGALAIITGHSTGDCARVLRQVSGKRSIMRIAVPYMLQAMDKLGIQHGPMIEPARGTALSRFMVTHSHGRYLVVITGHYCVIDTTTCQVCDNHTIYPLPIAKYSRQGHWVRKAWRIIEEDNNV